MSVKLTKKISFHRKQLYGDCWLYSSCTLFANFFFRYVLEQKSKYPKYNSLFENYDNDCDFTKQQKFTNFKHIVNKTNLQEI